MAKRQRAAGDEAEPNEVMIGTVAARPQKSSKAASQSGHAANKQPEVAARELEAAGIRARDISSAATFAQLQVCMHAQLNCEHLYLLTLIPFPLPDTPLVTLMLPCMGFAAAGAFERDPSGRVCRHRAGQR